MPTLTRWYIKSALLWLAAALTVAATLALRPLLDLPAGIAVLQLLAGWVFVATTWPRVRQR